MIKLTKIEKDFLIRNLELDSSEVEVLNNSETIDEDFADRLRDKCTEKLDYYGYDENYEPTQIGKELNKLIDKFFIG
ncbi:hypothetical protein ACOL3H_07000 [Aliarcobacter butzleri]